MVENIVNKLGAGSGIDTKALVEQLVEIERAPSAERLDTKKTLLESRISDYGVLRSALATLEDSIGVLADPNTFNAKSVNIPETNLLTPTKLDPEALTGDYQIKVTEIATAHSLSTATFDDNKSPIGKGTLTLRFGEWDDSYGNFTVNPDAEGATITIDDTNNSLQGLQKEINDLDIGVQATVIPDGSGYKLLLTAPSGASNEIEITVEEEGGAPTNTDNSGLSRFAFNTSNLPDSTQMVAEQDGVDAMLEVNGLEISRSSNRITDVIQGLEFTLNNKSDTEVINFSLSQDKSLAEQGIRDFVDSYNTFLETIEPLTGFNEETGEFGSLKSDALAKNLVQTLRSSIGNLVPGIDDGFNALTNVGIRTKLDGSLELIENDDTDADFRAAIDNNFDLVKQLFAPETSSSSAQIEVTKYGPKSVPGNYNVVISQDPTQGELSAGSMTIPLDTTGKDYSFVMTVNGSESDTISLPDGNTYNTAQELVDELQSLINLDPNLKASGSKIEVSFDTDHLVFTSTSFGSKSTVEVSSLGADAADLGLDVATATTGIDVSGTINGKAGFGFGNVLLPAIGSEAEGLSMLITPGASSGTINFSRGFAGGMSNTINEFLKTSGLIGEHEKGIREDIADIKGDKEDLDRRIEAFRARLESQFIAMDQIVQSLNTTGSFLDGLLDRLPFTAKK